MVDKIEKVCPVCYKFLNSIYDRKRMRSVKIIGIQGDSSNEFCQCKSIYHKKLTDRSSSSF